MWVIRESVKHILYMRGQIPIQYDELIREIDEEEQPRRRRRTEQQHSAKLVKNTEALFADIMHLFDSAPDIPLIAIVLGSSAFRPKEVYLFHFLNGAAPDTLHDIGACTRSTIRGLMMNCQDIYGISMPTTSLFILARGNRGLEVLAPAFLPKQRRKLTSPVNCHVTVRGNNEDECFDSDVLSVLASLRGEEESDDDEHLWYQSRSLIKGLKQVYTQ